jgi:hypothetical protein
MAKRTEVLATGKLDLKPFHGSAWSTQSRTSRCRLADKAKYQAERHKKQYRAGQGWAAMFVTEYLLC